MFGRTEVAQAETVQMRKLVQCLPALHRTVWSVQLHQTSDQNWKNSFYLKKITSSSPVAIMLEEEESESQKRVSSMAINSEACVLRG